MSATAGTPGMPGPPDAPGAPAVSPQDEPLVLAADFPEHSIEDWRALAAVVVNKSRADDAKLDPEAAEQRLQTRLGGDLVIDPLYVRPHEPRPLGVPGAMPFTRGRTMRDADLPWDVRALHEDPDVARSRAAVLEDLERGVSSVWVHLGADGIAAEDLGNVLADVKLDIAPVVVSSWDDQPGAAEALLAVLRGAEHPAGNLGLDPIGAAAKVGGPPDLAPLAGAVQEVAALTGVRAVTVDTRPYHDAGTSAVDEVGFAVATAVAYLRHLEGEGVPVADAFGTVEFRLAATADQFLTAATLRAMRRLWARVGELSGVPERDRGARTHAVTSARMFTRDDPWVNMLRSTLATFGASLGGADAITVLPYDLVLGLPERFSRRLARNTQIVLAEESNVARVTDPAGGAYYLESLTDDLAARAWVAFQEVERGGGMAAALVSDLVADKVGAANVERKNALATRSQPITGVSMFPMLGEEPLERLPRAELPIADGALPEHRDSEVYESLRDRAAAYQSEHGVGPTVLLAALGSRRGFGARQAFVANLLAAGGIAAPTVETDDPAEVLAAASEAGTPVVVLCSSKKGYAAHARDVVAGLRDGGVQQVLLAGRSRELGDRADVVDGEVHAGMDVVGFLGGVLDTLTTAAAKES